MSQSAAPAESSLSSVRAAPSDSQTAAFVNPISGLANDYLNLFNEIVMLIEQLPIMPELMSDLLAWKPTTYNDYFERSQLSGKDKALEAYRRLDLHFRREFEEIVSELDRIATGAVAWIRRHHKVKGTRDPKGLAASCQRFGAHLRAVLTRATNVVNHGATASDEGAQARADRLMAVRMKAMKDVRDFEAFLAHPHVDDD